MPRKVTLPAEQREEVLRSVWLVRDLATALEADVERGAPAAAIRDTVRVLLGEVEGLAAFLKVQVRRDAS